MVAIRIVRFTIVWVLALSPLAGQSDDAKPQTLFAQSALETLNREFPNTTISFLLMDANSGAVLASRWNNVEKPIPLGSLVKPFAALAYGEQHAYKYPMHVCRGKATGCWLPRGHGEVDLTKAIADSCNSYFRVLTNGMTETEVLLIAARFNLEAPPSGTRGAELFGLGTRWKITPLSAARAYAELAKRRDQPGVREIIAGLAQSARQGTGRDVDRTIPFPDALVKTGTAACTHENHSRGDGFTVAIAPAEHPRVVLLVRVHGVPGSHAATVAGEMLKAIGE